MALPDRIARSRAGVRGRWRLRRQLTAITRGLAKDTALAAKFAMFNALTKGEPASGAEPLRRPGWRLPRFGWPLRGPAVAIAAMTAVLVAGLLFSLAMRPVARTCLMLASAGSPATAAPAAAPAASSQPVGGVARARAPACAAYPAKK